MLFQAYVIPTVALEKMSRVGVFAQYGRSVERVCDSSCITVIPAEPRGGVVIAAIAHIIHAEGIGVEEFPATLLGFRQGFLAGHPEAVEVGDAHIAQDACIIVDGDIPLEKRVAPKSEASRGVDVGSTVGKPFYVAATLGFYRPTVRTGQRGREYED